MNELAVQNQAPVVKAKMYILNGPLKGRSFKLLSSQVSIGRLTGENDIVLSFDPYCSKHHAIIFHKEESQSYFVKRLSQKGHLLINKKPVPQQMRIKNNDVLSVGQTQMKLKILKKTQPAIFPAAASPLPQIPSKAVKKQNSPLVLLIILLIIGGGGLFLFTTSPSGNPQNTQRKNEIQLRTKEEFESDLTQIQEMEKETDAENQIKKSPEYRNAQQAYLKGIRDYRQGLFGRAKESFRVCKTLYPRHKLCSGYLKKSEIKYQQLAQRNLVLGKQYLKKKQYRQCAASFQMVVTMMAYDSNNKLYKEALSNLNLCTKYTEERY